MGLTMIDYLGKIIEYMSRTQEEPVIFGDLYMKFLFGVIFISIALCAFFHNANDTVFRVIVGVLFYVMLFGELLKQIVAPMSIDGGVITYSYNWGAFPFQLCSTPLYILPLVVFLPESKIRDAAAIYIMTVGFIGGAAVYATPHTVFNTNVFSNLHTMTHHGIQIVSGIYVACHYRKRVNVGMYLRAMLLFGVMLGIAIYLDTSFYDMLVSTGRIEEGFAFNMFYISPRVGMHSPFYEEWLNSFPPKIYISMYAAIIVLASIIVVTVAKLISMLCTWIASKCKGKAEGICENLVPTNN